MQEVERQLECSPVRIHFTPQGEVLKQERVEQLAAEKHLLLIAGHYEGIDERVIETLDPLELSTGDYVLSGGELPALLLVDAVVGFSQAFLVMAIRLIKTPFRNGAVKANVFLIALTTRVPVCGMKRKCQKCYLVATTQCCR